LFVPGGGHGVGSNPYGTRRQRDFFVRHLLGVEPPKRNGASRNQRVGYVDQPADVPESLDFEVIPTRMEETQDRFLA
jgi:hypothetical protein